MPAIKVIHGQELIDLTDEDKIFDAADLNGLSITDELTAGALVDMPAIKLRQLNDETITPIAKPIEVKSLAGQTWVDMVLQQLGDEERLFELTDLNDAGITEDLTPGTVIASPDYSREKKSIVNVLQVNNPSSEKEFAPGVPTEEGIEYWAIEVDFIVS